MEFLSPKTKEQIQRLIAENTQLKSDLASLQSAQKSTGPWKIIAVLAIISSLVLVFFLWSQSPRTAAQEVELWREGASLDTVVYPNSGLVYSIQLAAMEDRSLRELSYGLESLEIKEEEEFDHLVLGRYESLPDAQKMHRVLVKLGLENAFIVAYKDGIAVGLLSNKTAIN